MEACASVLLARGSPCKNLRIAAETYRALLVYEKVFGNGNPVEVEVGCGNGGFICELAAKNPQVNYLAVEVCTNVILTAMERVLREGIGNVKFLNIPAEILCCYVPEGSVRKIYLNFSTPLPGSSHEKQRLTSPRFLSIYGRILEDGGTIEQKTDSAFFFDYSLEQYALAGYHVREVTRDLHNSP